MKKNSIRAAALACCFFMLGCRQAPMQSQSSEYDVLTVATTDRTIPVDYSATIRGRQDIAIYAQVSGKIAQVCINEGQRVRSGQTLFIIDQVPYKAALQTAEANVAAAKASVATAQLTYDSKKELFARKVVSQFDLSTAENNLLTAKAQFAQASVQLRAAFPNPNGLLHSGGAGNIILPYVRKQCVVIPQAATFELQDKVYVYKVVDGKATSAAIAVDRISNGREYIVNSGLVPGDVIVAEGVGLMREGTPVQPKAQKAAAPSADQAAAQPETAKEE